LTRFNAIGPPMAPTPTNPTFPVMTISLAWSALWLQTVKRDV
jgi:hypothetical protein